MTLCELCEEREATKQIRRAWGKLWVCDECLDDLMDIKILEETK